MNFTLTERDSWEFARLSGDFNPLHVDPIAARRLQFGGTVCHGVHLVLKALDLAAAAGLLAPERIDGISAVFGASVRTGTPVTLDLPAEAGATQLRLVASTEGRPLFTAKLSLADAAPAAPPPSDAEPDAPHAPLCPAFPAAQPMPALADQVPLRANRALMQALLPHLAGSAQGCRIATDLLATTRIVGMRCPGLHSIYSELKLRRCAPSAQTVGAAMPYAVNRADERFRSVRIGVTGAALEGTLGAFFRAPPVAQPLLTELRLKVGPRRFAGQHALVVGGSRGLGELVAKLLLAGGAKVALTYAHGQVVAERICQEAADQGLAACAWHLDASRPLPTEVSELRCRVQPCLPLRHAPNCQEPERPMEPGPVHGILRVLRSQLRRCRACGSAQCPQCSTTARPVPVHGVSRSTCQGLRRILRRQGRRRGLV
ncbi:MAG: hypothetical protein IPO19_00055 [Rhodoferax sp.]|nr:hypothetical protein [Rhodoferax sp.]